MPDDVPAGWQPPSKKFSYEDETKTARRFDPSGKPFFHISRLIPPVEWVIYPFAPDTFLLVEYSHFSGFSRLLSLDQYLPSGKIFDRDKTIEWLARHECDPPAWIEEPSESLALTERESNVIQALGSATMTAEKLSKAAGYPNNSSFRELLSQMVKRKILGKRDGGGYYRL